jgi:DNA transposition AAA+ family ATPase
MPSHLHPEEGNDPCNAALIDSLRRFVEDSDLSIYQIAALIGTSAAVLSMWLAGTARPHRTELTEIKRLLKLNS